VRWYQKGKTDLDFTEARVSEWQWHQHQLGPVQVYTSLQTGFTFLVPAHPGSPGKRAVKWVCVCVKSYVHSTEHFTCKSKTTGLYTFEKHEILVVKIKIFD